MATAPAPLTSARRGFCKTPHSYFKSLPRRLSPVEHVILGNILDDTLGAFPERQWCEAKLAYFAYLANCTEDTAQKAVKRLEHDLQLIRSRRVGKGKEYQAVIENFELVPERKARRFGAAALEKVRARFRKPPTVAASLAGEAARPDEFGEAVPAEDNYPLRETGDTIKVVDNPVQAVEIYDSESQPTEIHYSKPVAACPHCGRRPDEHRFTVSSLSTGASTPLTDRTPALDNGCSESVREGSERPALSELETFCVETITPVVSAMPDRVALARAVKALGRAPVQMLINRITQRLDLFKSPRASWGALSLLAEDVAKAHHALTKLRGRAPAVEMSAHWKSATEIRKLHRDAATPEHLRREILIMWPELKAERTSTRFADGFAEFLKKKDKR